MTLYEFCIIASGLDSQSEDFEERFYEMGCDDATIAFQKGHIIVDFAREAHSVDAAIASALAFASRGTRSSTSCFASATARAARGD